MPGLLTHEERKRIADEVADLIFNSPTNLKPILNNHVTRIDPGSPPINYGYNVVIYCERLAWVENPALIIRLLKFWSIDADIQAIIKRLEQLPVQVFHIGTARDTSLLALELPFIGREVTRDAIDSFLQPLPAQPLLPSVNRVLIVNGEKGSGKTYTHNYINYINFVYTTERFKTIYLDFETFVGGWFGPAELAEQILKGAGASTKGIPILKSQQPARLSIELSLHVASELNALAKKNLPGNFWVIVLDRFNNPKVPLETIEFIQLLGAVAAGEIHRTETNDILRLVLLGFNHPLNTFEERITHDNIEPISRNDLKTYFVRYGNYRKVNLDPATVDFMIDTVLQKDPGPGPGQTAELAKWALRVAQKI